jgi:DNA-binding transcriptional regulator WhiA
MALLPILLLIQKAMELGGDIAPIALRAFAELRKDYPDAELTSLARQKNDLDEKKINDLIARADQLR